MFTIFHYWNLPRVYKWTYSITFTFGQSFYWTKSYISTLSYCWIIPIFFILYVFLLTLFFFISFEINWSLDRRKCSQSFLEIQFWNIGFASFFALYGSLVWLERWILASYITCGVTLFVSVVNKTLVSFVFVSFLHVQHTFILRFRAFTVYVVYHLIPFKFIIFNIWKELWRVSWFILFHSINSKLLITVYDGQMLRNNFILKVFFMPILNYIGPKITCRRRRYILNLIFELKLDLINNL